MAATASDQRRAAFAGWLRTGRVPAVRSPEGLELKFNPWHDPENGQFTFAGAGRQYGPGQAATADAVAGAGHVVYGDDPAKPRIESRADADAWRTRELARNGNKPGYLAAIEARHRQYLDTLAAIERSHAQPPQQQQPQLQPTPVVDFAIGVGEGVGKTAVETAKAAYDALTTNPLTTAREIGRGIAAKIDRALAAEDTPARVQASRAVAAVRSATPRQLGRGVGRRRREHRAGGGNGRGGRENRRGAARAHAETTRGVSPAADRVAAGAATGQETPQ